MSSGCPLRTPSTSICNVKPLQAGKLWLYCLVPRRLCLSENDKSPQSRHNASWEGSSLIVVHHGQAQAENSPLDPSHDPLRTSLVLVSLVPKSARARLGTRQVVIQVDNCLILQS